MRLYPAGWAFTRVANEDVLAEDIEIKKEEIVLISPYMLGRNEKLHSNANEFNPTRFLDDSINRDAYIPFGMGPQNLFWSKFRHIRA